MTKLYKVETFILDVNERYSNIGEIFNEMEHDCVIVHIAKSESCSLDWNDDHPLNYNNAPIEEFDKYFGEDHD
jgi:hypothetical protein